MQQKDSGQQDSAETRSDDSALTERYRLDGVVYLPGALSAATLSLAQEAYQWSLHHPGPGAAELPSKGSGTFYQDLANPAAFAHYLALLSQPEIGDIVSRLWGKDQVWFMYEQVFTKSGGTTRRTPWHQDSSYLPIRGQDLAVMWIPFDPVDEEHALEFVAGSHRGPLFDGSSFDPEDDTAPLYGDGQLPRLPDIEAARTDWPIVSWRTDPGDVVVFHPAVLHGGGATEPSRSRRTLSLRFFGEDAVVASRPGNAAMELEAGPRNSTVHPLTRMRGLPDGTPFRDPDFPAVRPGPAAERNR